MLQNELYIGNMVQGKKHQRMRSKQRLVDKENWIRVENTHEPIIDHQLWDKVQKLLTKSIEILIWKQTKISLQVLSSVAIVVGQ